MPETLLAVRNEVKSRLMLLNASEDGRVDAEIRAAIRQLMGKPYWFLEKLGTVALAAGDSAVSAPADFNILGSASIIQNGRRYTEVSGEFRVLKYQDLEALYLDTDLPAEKAYPDAMAIVGNSFYFSHTLTEPAALSLRYYCKDVALPVNTNDTSVFFGDECLDVVIGLSQVLFEARAQGGRLDVEIANSFVAKLNREHERRYMVGLDG
jgi:hypothetical protein